MYPRPKPQAPEGDAQQGDASAGAVSGTASASGTASTKSEDMKAGEPPAQAGDEQVETRVAKAEPVIAKTLEQGKAELDANPARTSVQTAEGVLVREG